MMLKLEGDKNIFVAFQEKQQINRVAKLLRSLC